MREAQRWERAPEQVLIQRVLRRAPQPILWVLQSIHHTCRARAMCRWSGYESRHPPISGSHRQTSSGHRLAGCVPHMRSFGTPPSRVSCLPTACGLYRVWGRIARHLAWEGGGRGCYVGRKGGRHLAGDGDDHSKTVDAPRRQAVPISPKHCFLLLLFQLRCSRHPMCQVCHTTDPSVIQCPHPPLV